MKNLVLEERKNQRQLEKENFNIVEKVKVKGENLFNFHFLIFKIIKQKLIDKNVICKKYNVKINKYI